MSRRKYLKKRSEPVIAVRLDLLFKHFDYEKWGGIQRAKRGDWLVDSDGDVYTVDARVFSRTYKRVRPGIYLKEAPVWAEIATEGGTVKTKEGASRYKRGDYIVYKNRTGTDRYCISAARFEGMYRLYS
jgi:hypothetical protein